MQPGLSIDLRERCDSVPSYVPDNLLPAPDLDVVLDSEFRVAGFEEGDELVEAGGLDIWGYRGVREEPNFSEFGCDVFYEARGGLGCSYPCLL